LRSIGQVRAALEHRRTLYVHDENMQDVSPPRRDAGLAGASRASTFVSVRRALTWIVDPK